MLSLTTNVFLKKLKNLLFYILSFILIPALILMFCFFVYNVLFLGFKKKDIIILDIFISVAVIALFVFAFLQSFALTKSESNKKLEIEYSLAFVKMDEDNLSRSDECSYLSLDDEKNEIENIEKRFTLSELYLFTNDTNELDSLKKKDNFVSYEKKEEELEGKKKGKFIFGVPSFKFIFSKALSFFGFLALKKQKAQLYYSISKSSYNSILTEELLIDSQSLYLEYSSGLPCCDELPIKVGSYDSIDADEFMPIKVGSYDSIDADEFMLIKVGSYGIQENSEFFDINTHAVKENSKFFNVSARGTQKDGNFFDTNNFGNYQKIDDLKYPIRVSEEQSAAKLGCSLSYLEEKLSENVTEGKGTFSCFFPGNTFKSVTSHCVENENSL